MDNVDWKERCLDADAILSILETASMICDGNQIRELVRLALQDYQAKWLKRYPEPANNERPV